MQAVLEWMKGIVILFVILSALLQLVPQKKYQKYIQFFVELIIVIAIIGPIAKVIYASEDLDKKIEYSQFWQELENLQRDAGKMEYIQSDYYIKEYEKVIAADITQMAESNGFSVVNIQVLLSAGYELQTVDMQLAGGDGIGGITIGKIIANSGSEGDSTNEAIVQELKQEISQFYQLEDSQITIQYVGE